MINIKLSDLLEAHPSRNQLVDEQELRLFLIPKNGGGQCNNSKKAKPKYIKISWKDVIKKVRVDKNCSEAELVAIKRACFYVGINPKFIKYRPNVNTSQSKGIYNNVDFELFDIDNGAGAGMDCASCRRVAGRMPAYPAAAVRELS